MHNKKANIMTEITKKDILDAAVKIVQAQGESFKHGNFNAVYNEIAETVHGVTKEEEETSSLVPAVHPKKSVFPDYIICLEDGKKLKMLKRYLATRFNLTPDQYRARWGLPGNYPMTCPNYVKQRSGIAKSIGLGHKVGGKTLNKS